MFCALSSVYVGLVTYVLNVGRQTVTLTDVTWTG